VSDSVASTSSHLDSSCKLMAQPAPPRHRYTYAEYLAYEQDSGLKHEFFVLLDWTKSAHERVERQGFGAARFVQVDLCFL
jgi:hypothetical protein